MKKFLLPILAACLFMTGCVKETYVLGSQIKTHYFDVEPGQWKAFNTYYDDYTYTTNYYYADFNDSDITKDVIDNGVVLVYFIDADGRDNILPYTLYVLNPDNSTYQERIEYDLVEGHVTFKIKDSDFRTAENIANIGTLKFKVSVIQNM